MSVHFLSSKTKRFGSLTLTVLLTPLFFQNCSPSFKAVDTSNETTNPRQSPLFHTQSETTTLPVRTCDPKLGWICMSNPLLPKDTAVGAWYSIYWYQKNGSSPDHWAEWTRYKPELGYYDSGDIIPQQYPLLKRAGIDYLLLDNTNGWGNDGGLIAQNAKKVFDKMPHDIPVALASGFPLWNGQASAEKRVIDMQIEADLIWNELAQRPNHLKWYDSGTYKPLFVVYNDIQNPHPQDEIKRYWKDPRFTVRYSAGATDASNPLLAPYAKEGLWGWAVHYPQIVSSETMAVQPGHNTTHLPGRTAPPVYKNQGQSYMQQWLYVLKHRPRNVIIPSWNDWGEETAIEPARRVVGTAELFTDYYGEETPDWYLQITEAYTNLRLGLMPGVYYRTEDDSKVYKVENGKLIPEQELPRRKPVIMLPAGALSDYLNQTPPPEPRNPTPTPTLPPAPTPTVAPTATPPPIVTTPTPTPTSSISEGYFLVGANVFYSNGYSYCSFQSLESFRNSTGRSSTSGIRTFSQIPSSMGNDGICDYFISNQTAIPTGLFRIGIDLYYSNGAAFCYFPSMDLFTRRTGKTTIVGIPPYSRIPTIMKNEGHCQ
jgi:hypothetical protein